MAELMKGEPFRGGVWFVELDGTMIYQQSDYGNFTIPPEELKSDRFFFSFLKYPYFDWNTFMPNWVKACNAAGFNKIILIVPL